MSGRAVIEGKEPKGRHSPHAAAAESNLAVAESCVGEALFCTRNVTMLSPAERHSLLMVVRRLKGSLDALETRFARTLKREHPTGSAEPDPVAAEFCALLAFLYKAGPRKFRVVNLLEAARELGLQGLIQEDDSPGVTLANFASLLLARENLVMRNGLVLRPEALAREFVYVVENVAPAQPRDAESGKRGDGEKALGPQAASPQVFSWVDGKWQVNPYPIKL